ncbi:hypothetical protein IAD21_02774 [Abditibacteriota bacterium]|nr:hypothetical protein IAD21_02774 [Abditibacteriota bacterium]
MGAQKRWQQIQNVPFFAVPVTRPHTGLIPVFSTPPKTQASSGGKPLFYVLPTIPRGGEKPSAAVVELYAYRDEKTGRTRYSTDTNATASEKRSDQPLCRVWHSPSTTLVLDYEGHPIA